MWREYPSWEQAEKHWDYEQQQAAKEYPIKAIKKIPNMVGIIPETEKNLKWKSLKWMISKDHQRYIVKNFLRHPFKYGWNYLKSLFQKRSYTRDGDFFYYGLNNLDMFLKGLQQKNTLFVLGFSYCHKPFECPSGRFTPNCIHDVSNPVCKQCFIAKAMYAAPQNAVKLLIPTVHYIGRKIFEIIHDNPDKQVYFMITACEMTLRMFGDWGNMVGIKGIGVRLDGRICNTMKAFELSEQGIKPGLTVVLKPTQKKVLEILKMSNFNPKFIVS